MDKYKSTEKIEDRYAYIHKFICLGCSKKRQSKFKDKKFCKKCTTWRAPGKGQMDFNNIVKE